MTQVVIRYYADAHHCGYTETGREFLAVGCAHRSPRSAITHSDTLSVPAETPGLDPSLEGSGVSAGVLTDASGSRTGRE